MSEFHSDTATDSAFTATTLGRTVEDAPFVTWQDKFAARAVPATTHAGLEIAEAIMDLDALRAEAFAGGVDEGRRTAEAELASERNAVARLAETLEQYRPEPPAELAALLAETVDRLVRQVVGEVTLDTQLLERRAAAVAQIIADTAAPRRMRLHPEDVARLGKIDLDVELIPDAGIAPGSLFVETGGGWVEDGPEVGLEKLRQALDRMSISQ